MRCLKLLVQLGTALMLMLLVAWVSTTGPASEGSAPTPFDPEDAYQGSMKTILFWNRFFEIKHFGQRIGHKMFDDYECEERRCFVADYQDGEPLPLPVDEFDMVVFHGVDMDSHSIPATRKQHQRYVFLLQESPATFPIDLHAWDGFFNLTATYRRDSDFYAPYGWLVPRGASHTTPPERYQDWLEPPVLTPDKPRLPRLLAAWLVSNCVNTPSNRDELVRELAQYIPIEVLGRCGRACVDDECNKNMLDTRYEFYLALENSLCKDYITEKFFSALDSNMIPVVFGGADYSQAAPPGSYINAADFESPKQLAEHLLKLDADPEAYEKHFWWKRHYEVRGGTNHVMCQMCAMLHNSSLPASVVTNLHSWWHDDACDTPSARLVTWLLRLRDTPVQFAEQAFVRLARQDVGGMAFFGVLAFVIVYLVVVLVLKWRHVDVTGSYGTDYRLMSETTDEDLRDVTA